MTAILAIADGSHTLMAGDGLICLGGLQYRDSVPKVRQSGRMVWGAAGGARECDLAMANTMPRWSSMDPYQWGVRRLVPWLTDQLDSMAASDDPELNVLLGVGGTLLFVDNRLSVTSPGPYFAIGSAAEVALGALDASRHCQPWTQLRRAQEAVERLCSGVGGEWAVVEG